MPFISCEPPNCPLERPARQSAISTCLYIEDGLICSRTFAARTQARSAQFRRHSQIRKAQPCNTTPSRAILSPSSPPSWLPPFSPTLLPFSPSAPATASLAWWTVLAWLLQGSRTWIRERPTTRHGPPSYHLCTCARSSWSRRFASSMPDSACSLPPLLSRSAVPLWLTTAKPLSSAPPQLLRFLLVRQPSSVCARDVC